MFGPLNKLTSCFKADKSIKLTKRIISVGNRNCLDEIYPDNKIFTSKYTFCNFVPKNLFEQFHRIANIYFAIVTVISFFVDTSVSAWATLLPLLFVVLVTATKQGYEDWLRHKSDEEANKQLCFILREGELKNLRSSDIKVGDIIKVEEDNEIPCDIVLLSSSEVDGTCHVTTVNLDGETNLKVFTSPRKTLDIINMESIIEIQASIECEQPTADLYKFIGKMDVDGCDKVPLTASNLLLRGTRLKNTDYIIGCAVYTGQETKISLNTLPQGHKSSRIEKKLNKYLIFYIGVLIILSSLWVVWSFLFSTRIEMQEENIWYISNAVKFNISTVIKEFLIFTVLFNYILPISMYVTIELQKFFGSIFFQWDIDLYDPAIDERAKANISDLNEELGQIEYLFTDKTGTLTENSMEFRAFFVGGKFYEEVQGVGLVQVEDDDGKEGTKGVKKKVDIKGNLQEMLICMALCHTVRVDHHHHNHHHNHSSVRIDHYQSTSPDEKALVEACSRFGVTYQGTKHDTITLAIRNSSSNNSHDDGGDDDDVDDDYGDDDDDVDDDVNNSSLTNLQIKTFALRHVLEFDSCRKKMTVIVEELYPCNDDDDDDDDDCDDDDRNEMTSARDKSNHPINTRSLKFKGQGHYKVICKGAETAVMEGVERGDVEGVEDGLNQFAESGYRTLVYASKDIDEDQYKSYDQILKEANESLDNREEMLQEAYCNIENHLVVLGCTAVEDELQSQVHDTIQALRMAGIKIWVLTGDKEETAVNVSYSAGHMTKDMNVLSLTRQTGVDGCLENLISCIQLFESTEKQKHALIVDGKTCSIVTKDSNLFKMFSNFSMKCDAVLCCRLDPIQKATMVKMVKLSKGKPTTAAVGDGANDVNMILEAHVGIGIIGKEGRQASRSSDFAIGKFKHLRKVILVHGHYFYVRLAVLVLYFFYKNVALTAVQLLYTFYSAFSAQTFFSSYYLIFYNTTFTALPIFLYGLFEKHVPDEVLMMRPSLYRFIRKNKMMNILNFTKWNVIGLWHALASFFGTYFIICSGASIFEEGWDIGIFDAGSIVMTSCVLSVNLKLLVETCLLNWIIIVGFILSISGYFFLTCICSKISPPILEAMMIDHSSLTIFISATSSLCILLIVIGVLLPDVLMRVCKGCSDGLYSAHTRMEGMKQRMRKESNLQMIDVEITNYTPKWSSSISINPQTNILNKY